MKTGAKIPFDPYRITHNLQSTMLSYIDNPPRMSSGESKFLCALGSRQVGKSNTPAAGFLIKTMRNPEFEAATIADKDSRALGLLKRAHSMYRSFPAELRVPLIHDKAMKHLNFIPEVGGTYSILSAQKEDVGIGLSVDALHASEVAFWPDAASVITGLTPALFNRENALFVAECTPAPPSAPSMEYWRDMCALAKRGEGRWTYVCAPHWDSVLNSRPVPDDFVPTVDELRRLDKYEDKGLTFGNLQFRRIMLASNPALKRWPELFDVWFLSDDVSCWIQAGFSAVPNHAIQPHIDSALHTDMPPGAVYHEFEPPTAQAAGRYVIGVDPASTGADHSAFVVLEVWNDEIRQVASYSSPHVDTVAFSKAVETAAVRYGNAMVAVERNGIGQAIIDNLIAAHYPNIYCEKPYKPGLWASQASNARLLTHHIDKLMDSLVILDTEIVSQAARYQNQKLIAPSDRQLASVKQLKRAGDRSHYDRLSALMVALWAARAIGGASKPRINNQQRLKVTLTADEWAEYRNALKADKAGADALNRPNQSRVVPYKMGTALRRK